MKKKLLLSLFFLLVFLFLFYLAVFSSLPNDRDIMTFFPESTVENFVDFDWDASLIVPVRKYVPLKEISINLERAVIISEDDTFFRHSGVRMDELKIAFKENWEKKRFVRGASTISMQLARNAFLHKQKTLLRKLREIIVTRKIEKLWDKNKIFEYYLNIVEWGPNIYGAEAAAHYYFDKKASQLTLAEATLMASILPNPIYYNPFNNYSGAKKKQARVLKLMKDAGLVSAAQMKKIKSNPPVLRGMKKSIKEQLAPKYDLFDSALNNPRLPDSLRIQADSLGILFLPEEKYD